VAGALNGASNQMRKQADEQRVVDERFCGGKLSLIYIDDVGDFLERVKRNSWRQDDAKQWC